ncbi:hypothetical protein ACFC0S_03065 [Streptomyces sp. NPDC056084]
MTPEDATLAGASVLDQDDDTTADSTDDSTDLWDLMDQSDYARTWRA